MPSSGRLRHYMQVPTDIFSGKTQKINNNSLNVFNMYNNPNFVKVKKKRFLNKHTQVCFYIYFYIYTSVKT